MKTGRIIVVVIAMLSLLFISSVIFAGGSKEKVEKKAMEKEELGPMPGEPMDKMATRIAKALTGGKPVELHVLLTWDAPGQALLKVIPEWESATGIKVFTEPLSTIEMSQKVNLELASGQPEYDIIQYDRYIHKPVLENPGVLNLDPYIKKYDPHFETMVRKGIEQWGVADDGTHRAMPFYWCNYIMAYRKDLIDDPKERAAFKKKYGYEYEINNLTWDKSFMDLVEFFTRDTDGDGKIDFWGNAEMYAPYAACDTYMARYLNYWDRKKPSFLSDPKTGQCTINDEAGLKAFKDMLEVVYRGHTVPEILQTDWASILGTFASGRCAVAFQYAPTWSPIQAESSEFKISGPDQVGFAHVPGIKGKPRSTQDCGWISFITGNTDIPEISYLFLLWAGSEEIDRKMALTSLHNPIRKATYEDTAVIAVNPTFAAQFEYAENMYTTPDHLIYEEEILIVSNVMAALVNKEISFQEAINRICREVAEKWAEVKQK
ncbi:MAG: ABC transporter substrate-binding protein [Thermodesulfovibrionales bacterium]